MYKIGDIVTCKKNFYLKKRRNIFSSPFFKKSKNYIITDIKKSEFYESGVLYHQDTFKQKKPDI